MKTVSTATLEELKAYLEDMLNIAQSKNAYDTWKDLYNTIFSDEFSGEIHKRFPEFDWYDPDSSYEDDVTVYMEELIYFLNNKMNEKISLIKSFSNWIKPQNNEKS